MAEPTKIPEEHITILCRPGKGADTCIFLTFGGSVSGFSCARGSDYEGFLSDRARMGRLRAQGINCKGPPSFEPTMESFEPLDDLID